MLVFLLVVVLSLAQEGQGFTLDASFGFTVPTGDYQTYTKSLGQANGNNLIGFTEEITGKTQFNFDASYQFGVFGAGLSFGIFSHEISSLNYEINFPVQLEGGQINGTYYGIGPNYMTPLGDFTFTAFLRGGLMDVSLYKFIGSYDGTDVNQPIEILNTELSSGSKSSLGYVSLGVKFSYPIYQGFSAFVQAEYLTSFGDGLEIMDTYVTPFDGNDDGAITSADTDLFVNIDNRVEELRFLKPQFANFVVGLGYSFGDTAKMPVTKETAEERKARSSGESKRVNDSDSDGDGFDDIKDSTKINQETNDKLCFRAELVSPLNQQDIFLNTKNRPDYKWQTPKADNILKPSFYVIKLYDQNDNVLFSSKTQKSRLNHNTNLEKVYTSYFDDKRKSIYWEIESHYKDCSLQVSKRRMINGSKRNVGLIADFRNVTCDTPAYSDNGEVCYKAEVYLENPLSNTTSITIPVNPNFTVTNISLGNSSVVTNRQFCSSTSFVSDITLQPGASQTVCFEFCRPIGETQAVLNIQYHETQFPNLLVEEKPVEDLPNCVCSICDDLQIVSTNESLWPLSAGSSNMRIRNDFQILSSDAIQQVKAEVVYVQHLINDEQCYPCTKSDDQMGMFKEDSKSGRILGMQNEWLNNGQADLYDENSDGYGNEFTWKAKFSSGVDFTNSKIFLMNLSLPHSSSLECCNTTYKVCVRYTFTNINCQSCDYLVCYEFDSEDVESGGTESGNQFPGDIKLTPKSN
jgi:hypothetical protein